VIQSTCVTSSWIMAVYPRVW